MNTKCTDICSAAIRRWLDEGAKMPTKAELPHLVECVNELLFAYTTLRQRTETLSAVLIDAAAHGMVLREDIKAKKEGKLNEQE
jgi:hypothetical protein